MSIQVFCADFQQANPCRSGKWTDHDFGPGADKPVPRYEDELATRECAICSLVIYVDDNDPDGICPYAERRAA